MSILVDDIVVSPKEVVPNGVEQSLSEAGLSIIGAHFGEVVKKGTEVQTAGGVVMVDRKPQTRTVVLKLQVREDSDVTLPEAAERLEQIVGALQAREGWFRRDFHVGGNFASLLYRVCGEVTFGDFAGWQVGDSPDVSLSMVCEYGAYATEEEESEVFEEAEERELVFELSDIGGSVDGLIRLLITNEGEEHWRACTVAMESRDHPQDASAYTTAKPIYGCQKLTLKGGSTKAERDGFKVVRHSSLTLGWLTILNGEIDGVGDMTHKGVRRPKVRAYDPGDVAGNVQLRLRYRNLGTLQWTENPIVKTPIVDGWQELDMGEARLEEAAIGDQRWEWEIQARAISGSGAIDLHRFRCLPTEVFHVVTAPEVAQAADLQSQKSPGTVEDNNGVGSVEWKSPGNAKAQDASFAKAELKESKTERTSHYLLAKTFGFLIPEDATLVELVAQVRRRASVADAVKDHTIKLLVGGVPAGNNRKEQAIAGQPVPYWATSAETVNYSGSLDIWGVPTLTPGQLMAEGFGLVISATHSIPGSVDAEVDAISILAYYTEASDPNRVCFAGRSIEFGSDGVRRQHLDDDVWGVVVPVGSTPPAAFPSGAEGRATRVIVVPSEGDLAARPDTGVPAVAAQALIRTAGLFASDSS